MTSGKDPVSMVNDTGCPLQIAVENLVARTVDQHGWKVRYVEPVLANARKRLSEIDFVFINQGEDAAAIRTCL